MPSRHSRRSLILGAAAVLGGCATPAGDPTRIERRFRGREGVEYAIAFNGTTDPVEALGAWNGHDPKRRYGLLRVKGDDTAVVQSWMSRSSHRFHDAVPAPGGGVAVFRNADAFELEGPGRWRTRLPAEGATGVALAEGAGGVVLVLAASPQRAVYRALDPDLREIGRQVIELDSTLAPPVIANARRLEYRDGAPLFEIVRFSLRDGRRRTLVEGAPGRAAVTHEGG